MGTCIRCDGRFDDTELVLEEGGALCFDCELDATAGSIARRALWTEIASGPAVMAITGAALVAWLFTAFGGAMAPAMSLVLAVLLGGFGALVAVVGLRVALGRKDYGAFGWTDTKSRTLLAFARASGVVAVLCGVSMGLVAAAGAAIAALG